MSLGKHFINGATDPVGRSLRSCLYGRPKLRLIPNEKVLYQQPGDDASEKVLLLSGGGSGHEPAFSGYVGDGMLDIAVAGNIFASPSASQVGAGLRALESQRGNLMIVNNYTGDKLNFGLAAEKAKADGQTVNAVFVGEDVSVEGNSLVGQRGLAGIVLVSKVAGALAATGADLDNVTRVARKTASQIVTAAASLDRCSIPGRGKQEGLAFDEMEYGMGIHNEPGVMRQKVDAFEMMIGRVVDMALKTRPNGWYPSSDQEVAIMVNNLGGLSVLEMGIITDEIMRQLHDRDICTTRVLSGTFLTSLDGPGFSLTLLGLDEELQGLLDAPTSVPGWPQEIRRVHYDSVATQEVLSVKTELVVPRRSGVTIPISTVKKIVAAISQTTKEDEPEITEFDTIAGDGDCGETLLNGVDAFNKEVYAISSDIISPGHLFRLAATATETGMGGTSGAIYSIFLNAVANSLSCNTSTNIKDGVVSSLISNSLVDGLNELYKYTLARQGHRTLMDALIPFVTTLRELGFEEACKKAKEGAKATKHMEASLGRASYVSQDIFMEKGGIPDPGALGIVSLLRGIQMALGK